MRADAVWDHCSTREYAYSKIEYVSVRRTYLSKKYNTRNDPFRTIDYRPDQSETIMSGST